VIGRPGAPTTALIPSNLAGGDDWAGLDTIRLNVICNARIEGDLTGGVIASRIPHFRVDGLLNRAVTQGQNSTDADAAAMSVYAGQIGASGDIQARAGSIALVEVLG